MVFSLVIAALCCIATVNGGATGWNYELGSPEGPSHWSETYPDCGGVMQSPIDITYAVHDPELNFFDTSEYSITDGVTMTLHNVQGHTVEVQYAGKPVFLKGGSLPHEYQVDQFHFHWGLKDSRGSEHAVDGKHFPMEMHIVHHLASMPNGSAAMVHPYGLAVMGFFIEIGAHNPNFDQLLKHFHSIQNPEDHIAIPTMKLADLLPKPDSGNLDYYRYMGSLTTPPCYETVIWSMNYNAIVISEAQIDVFRSLFEDGHGTALGDDFRPIQPLNERSVLTTRPTGPGKIVRN